MNRSIKRSTLKTILQILKLDIKLSPGWIALDSGAMLISAVCYAFATVIKQLLFDSISDVVSGKKEIAALIFITVVVILFQFGNELINAICNFTWSPAMRSTAGKIRKEIHGKIARLPGNCFEDVKCLELIEKANLGAEKCYGLYNSLATIGVFYVPYFIVLGVYLFRLSPILLLALLFIFIPLVINLYIRQKIFTKQIDEIVPEKRKLDYYESEIYHRDFLKENRIFGAYSFFTGKYKDANLSYSQIRWKAEKKNAFIEIGLRSITLLGYIGVIFLIVILLMNGSISVGAFAAVFSSISTMITFMNDALGNYLGSIFENMGGISRVLDFFELEEEPTKKEKVDWTQDIEVRNLSFSYPNTNVKVLDNISFTIKGNQTIALVGENGAGKSTLIKILLGILHPDSGEILVGGENIHEIDPRERILKISAVFQKFNKYQISVKDNVQISSDHIDDIEFKKCLNKSEFVMDETFINGYDTILSKEFGGIDLSGGQWQRLAIARGLYRNSDFMTLDEPTAAIDPIEESILYRKFQQMVYGKKSIIVTHRMGSSKLADRIIVLKGGKVVEDGTYDELMKLGGEFASLYSEQAQWYNENPIEGMVEV